jgi:ribosomal small subunit protein bTHX
MEDEPMGTGDQRTKRGKINRGTHGKTRRKQKRRQPKDAPRKS